MLAATAPAAVVFDSSFESGNGTNFTEIAPGEYSFEIEPDSNSDDRQWFFFSVAGASGETVTFHLLNTDETNVPEHWAMARPVASSDGGESWRHVTGDSASRATTFTFTHEIAGDPERIAFHFPYSHSRALARIASWESHADVTRRVIGQSAQGRDIDLLTVGARPEEAEFGFWIICREHAAEVTGSWMLEGFMDFLLSEDPRARALRDRAVTQVVPMINPDGVTLGNYRDNAQGVNLNVVWDGRDAETCPEVPAVTAAIAEWVEAGHPYDFFASLHSSSAEDSNFAFHAAPSVEVPLAASPEAHSAELDALLALIEEHAPDFLASGGLSTSEWPNVSRQSQMFQHGVRALLFEGTYNHTAYGPRAGEFMTPERHWAIGRALAIALHEFHLEAPPRD